jgi:hypothetical protein
MFCARIWRVEHAHVPHQRGAAQPAGRKRSARPAPWRASSANPGRLRWSWCRYPMRQLANPDLPARLHRLFFGLAGSRSPVRPRRSWPVSRRQHWFSAEDQRTRHRADQARQRRRSPSTTPVALGVVTSQLILTSAPTLPWNSSQHDEHHQQMPMIARQIFLPMTRQPHHHVDAEVAVLLQRDERAEKGDPDEEPARQFFGHRDARVEAVAQHHVAEHQHDHDRQAEPR